MALSESFDEEGPDEAKGRFFMRAFTEQGVVFDVDSGGDIFCDQ
jgi:hypothetical protein